MEWITAHWGELWTIFASVVTTASLIARLTPTKWDDNILSKLVGLIALKK